jgi:hypothetical protein
MYLRVDVSGAVELCDPDDFERFKLVVVGGSGEEELAAALAPHGRLLQGGDALVGVEAVKELAGERASEPVWRARFAVMVEYARAHGWVDADGSSIRVHCERA